MTTVEQYHSGFQWAGPLRPGAQLKIERINEELRVTGRFPRYDQGAQATDLVREYEMAQRSRRRQSLSSLTDVPHIQFANADTDEKLVAFVSRFGPVVAKSTSLIGQSTDASESNATWPHLVALQDLQELRNERSLYRAALSLVVHLNLAKFDFSLAQEQIKEIVALISHWPGQWQRECTQMKRWRPQAEPLWRLNAESHKRLEGLALGPPALSKYPRVEARIVVCELLNVFCARAFPNALEMHSSIKYGIRPLLYSLLRREFLHHSDVGVCANTHCRAFFEVKWAGQQFCDADCSRKHRQREYWKQQGKTLRKQRNKVKRKAAAHSRPSSNLAGK